MVAVPATSKRAAGTLTVNCVEVNPEALTARIVGVLASGGVKRTVVKVDEKKPVPDTVMVNVGVPAGTDGGLKPVIVGVCARRPAASRNKGTILKTASA